MYQFSDLIGFVGTALIIGAYLLLQINRISSDGLKYSVLNGIGALLILYSLIYKFNFPAFVVEVFWVGISIFGVARFYLQKRAGAELPS